MKYLAIQFLVAAATLSLSGVLGAALPSKRKMAFNCYLLLLEADSVRQRN